MCAHELTFPSLQTLSTQPQLNGAQGSNRAQGGALQIHANNDLEAIVCWLNEYKSKATTYRTYQKESERFLLWCIYQRHKPLSSIDRQDIAAYLQFLDNPQPKNMWCAGQGGRGKKRGSVTWRPFVGPLSPRAKLTATSALDSLFNYLVQANYLAFNPMSLIRKKMAKSTQIVLQAFDVQARILQTDEWLALLDTLDALPEHTLSAKRDKLRLRLIIAMFFFLGLRVHELAQQTWQAFRKIEHQWWFFLIGKGDKAAKIPVNDELLKTIILYRSQLGKNPLPHSESEPIIISFRNGTRIGERQINKLLKKLALQTAKKFAHAPEKANKLKKFSAHWLRHLSASMQDKAGIAFKHIRANLRHENDDTTRLYVHTFDEERHQDSQKLTWR